MKRRTRPLKSDPPKRPLVLEAFICRHQKGLPFNQRDVAKDAECSGTLVSIYCKDYVRQVADRLLEEKIETDQDYERWRREFLTLRAFFNNTDRRQELVRMWVEVHINHIHRSGRLPTCTEVKRLCGSTDRAIRRALDYWSDRLGIPLQHAEIWKKISVEEVLTRVDHALHRLPLTFLESEALGIPFTDRQRRMIHNIRSQSLRNTAFFVMAFADRNRPNDMRFFTHLDKIMLALGIHEYPDIDADTFYENYHEKRLMPDDSDGTRLDFLQTYFRLMRRQADYLRKLNDAQRALIEPFLLKGIADDHFWRHSTLKLERDEKRVGRRKAQVAVVHAKFYQLREIAECRYQLMDRLCKAYAQAVAVARQGAKMPLRIQLEEDVFMPGRSAERMTFRLLLWDGPSLKKAHQQIGDRGYYDTRKGKDHPSNWADQFYLSYDNTVEAADSGARYWFSQLLSAALSKGNAQLSSLGFSRSAFNTLPRASVPTPVIGWHRVLRDHTNTELLPIDLCMTCCLMGNAAVQIMTKTGARANEFLQIRLDPQHLVQADLPNNAQAIAFHAIPKGRQAEEPFYIDERCMKTLFSWWKYRTGLGYSFARVEATQAP